jgi:hypothetical protein
MALIQALCSYQANKLNLFSKTKPKSEPVWTLSVGINQALILNGPVVVLVKNENVYEVKAEKEEENNGMLFLGNH